MPFWGVNSKPRAHTSTRILRTRLCLECRRPLHSRMSVPSPIRGRGHNSCRVGRLTAPATLVPVRLVAPSPVDARGCVAPSARTLGSSSLPELAPLYGVRTLARGGIRRVVMGVLLPIQRHLKKRRVTYTLSNGFHFLWLAPFRPLLPLTRDKGPNGARGSNKRIFQWTSIENKPANWRWDFLTGLSPRL